jgi:hypothetical protein
MKKSKSHSIRRFIQKIGVSFVRLSRLNPGEAQQTKLDRVSIGICYHLIKRIDSVLLMSPISHKRYIESPSKSIFIIIVDDMLTIVNHHYSYNINISGRSYERIRNMFDSELEKRRLQMESEIFTNVKHSLDNIYDKIKSNEEV